MCIRTKVHGFHDRAVLYALENAAPEIRVVRIERLDLNGNRRSWAVVYDVNPVSGLENDLRVGLEVRVSSVNPVRIVPDPESESPVVRPFACPDIADTVAFAAFGRGCGGQVAAKRVLEDPVPIPEGIDFCCDFVACVAPLLLVPVAISGLGKLGLPR